jgi:hypothetical protein
VEPVCSTCREHPRRPGQRTCTSCHAAYQRAWRAKAKADVALARQIIAHAKLTPKAAA